jgi:hypothetical protein
VVQRGIIDVVGDRSSASTVDTCVVGDVGAASMAFGRQLPHQHRLTAVSCHTLNQCFPGSGTVVGIEGAIVAELVKWNVVEATEHVVSCELYFVQVLK